METPWYETPTYFIVTLIIFLAGRAFDSWSSEKTNWYYGIKEGNSLLRNKDGNYDMSKNLMVSGIYLGVSILIGVLSHSWGAATAICIIPGFGSFVVGWMNLRKANKNRVEQIKLLRNARDTGGAGTYDFGPIITRNNKRFYQLFQWIYMTPTGDLGDDASRLAERLIELALHTDEKNWFPG